MKLDSKKFFFVLVGVNVLLVVATIAVFTLANSTAQKRSDQMSQLKADSETNDQLINYYKVLQGTLNANKDLQDTVQKVLPSDKDQSVALNDLNQFAQNTNVDIQQITFNPGSSKTAGQTLTSPALIKGVSIISVTLDCKSTRYESLLAFLQQIETTQRRMQVTTLNITPNATNPDLLDQVSISIDIYVKTGT